MVTDYEKYSRMTGDELCLEASSLAAKLAPLVCEAETNPSRFPEIKKRYDDQFRPDAVGIGNAVGSANRNWRFKPDVTPIFADPLSPTYLRKVIEILNKIRELYHKSKIEDAKQEILRLAKSADAYGYAIDLPMLTQILGASNAVVVETLKLLSKDQQLHLEKATKGRPCYNPVKDSDADFFYDGSFWLVSSEYKPAGSGA